MSKRKFTINYEGELDIEIEDAVFEQVTEEWKKVFYPLDDEESIVQMIGKAMLRGCVLSDLEGWSNMPDSNASILVNDIWWWDSTEILK